jgi:hypothetical protein
MVIVDSSVWIDALWGTATPQTIWLRNSIGKKPIGLTSLILCEVLQGTRTERQFRGFQQDLLQLPVFEAGSAQLAIAAARNFRHLRSRGVTVRTAIDCMIATFCIVEGYQLLHRDSDFDGFEAHLGLQVVDPLAAGLP